jgi:tRNA nucleotidyltransferase (CCA-adding enzyme)
MKTYIVGGWVRDRLLAEQGRHTRGGDRDWVVVGATPEKMVALGYKPVGRDFPVFLHPQTGEEYALARTERKTAPGYRGFVIHAAPDVTLEQDLQRRDLTINAMALDDRNQLVDPLNGRADLEARMLRHIGPAFAEDPVRILRLARFAARFPEFSIAAETLAQARQMVEAGEADALVPERVWQEVSRGLMEDRPSRLLEVLDATGLLSRLAPELRIDGELLAALDRTVRSAAPLPTRVAVLCAGAASVEGARGLLERLRADSESAQLARLLQVNRARLRSAADADTMAAVLESVDALRRPARFEMLLLAAQALDRYDVQRWRHAALAFAGIDAGSIARLAGSDAGAIARAIGQARRAALAAALATLLATPPATPLAGPQ